MNISFTPIAWEDYQHWIETDRVVAEKINRLLRDIGQTPFKGLGKPEPLKGNLAGWWSRRITGEHRLVYRVMAKDSEQRMEIASCRYHYG